MLKLVGKFGGEIECLCGLEVISPRYLLSNEVKNNHLIVGKPGRHYPNQESKVNIEHNITLLWCAEKNTKSLLHYSWQKCISSIYVWENI